MGLHINMTFMLTFKTIKDFLILEDSKSFHQKLKFKSQILIDSSLQIITIIYNNVFGLIFVPGFKSILGMMKGFLVFTWANLLAKRDVLVKTFAILRASAQVLIFVLFVA